MRDVLLGVDEVEDERVLDLGPRLPRLPVVVVLVVVRHIRRHAPDPFSAPAGVRTGIRRHRVTVRVRGDVGVKVLRLGRHWRYFGVLLLSNCGHFGVLGLGHCGSFWDLLLGVGLVVVGDGAAVAGRHAGRGPAARHGRHRQYHMRGFLANL